MDLDKRKGGLAKRLEGFYFEVEKNKYDCEI